MNRRSARRSVRIRTALFLCVFGAVGMALVSVLAALSGEAFAPWIAACGSLLFYAVPAYLGLFELDGDQSHLLMRQKLSGAQAMWACVCGALMVCPALLLSGMAQAVMQMFGAAAVQAQDAAAPNLVLPLLLASGVIAPVCEELFFRGYLLGAFARFGQGYAALLTALVFAAAHGISAQTPVLLAIGLLLAAAACKAQSLLAPMLLHIAYNMALVLLSALGLGGFLGGVSPASGVVLLMGSAGFVYALKRMWSAAGTREMMCLPDKKELLLALLPAVLVILAVAAAQLSPLVIDRIAMWLSEIARQMEEAKAAEAAAKAAWAVLEVLA